MDEARFVEILSEALELWREKQREEGESNPRLRIQTFEAAVVLTENEGLVVEVDRSKFQVTVVADPR